MVQLSFFFYGYKHENFNIMFQKSIKQIWITVAVVVIGCLAYFLLNFVFSSIQTAINGSNSLSNNQSGLEMYVSDDLGIIALFLSSVIFAPIIEEFSYRMIFSEITDNKWYSVVLTVIFFAFLHVQQTADFSHIFVYFALGIVNGLIYWKLKNVTPCILVHLITNLVGFIFMVA